MAENSILSIEIKDANGIITYVNPAHIVKVVNYNFNFTVFLTNGDVFGVSYEDARKIRDYFENAQRRLF